MTVLPTSGSTARYTLISLPSSGGIQDAKRIRYTLLIALVLGFSISAALLSIPKLLASLNLSDTSTSSASQFEVLNASTQSSAPNALLPLPLNTTRSASGPLLTGLTYIDTQSALPEHLLSTYEPEERYLAYLPHSGFHNQRIAAANALLLGYLLNRTVILPPVRLGKAISWALRSELEHRLTVGPKSGMVEECRPFIDNKLKLPNQCSTYNTFTDVSWSFLSNLSSLPVKIAPRSDPSQSYFTAPPPLGLGLHLLEIHTFPYSHSYDYQFFDSIPPLDFASKYRRHTLLSNLLSPPLAEKRLLYFGSLFGTGRIQLSPLSTQNRAARKRIMESFSIANSWVDGIAKEVIAKLGGRKGYASVHCRVGDGAFKDNERGAMEGVFKRLAGKVYDLEEVDLQGFLNGTYGTREERGGRCRRSLHTDPRFIKLNQPVYMATDSHNARADGSLAVFFRTFPCLRIISDFRTGSETIDDLNHLDNLHSDQDGLPLGKFLIPFLEAQIASMSLVGVVGTPKSTFSAFLRTLQDVYSRGEL